jgi:hypothetical protein
MEISGRIFHINHLNDKVIQVVLRKKINGKQTPIAFAVLGYWKDIVLNDLKLKPKDKIRATVVLKSNLYKGKYYTDVTLKNIELLQEKIKEDNNSNELQLQHMDDYIVDEETGEILL